MVILILILRIYQVMDLRINELSNIIKKSDIFLFASKGASKHAN